MPETTTIQTDLIDRVIFHRRIIEAFELLSDGLMLLNASSEDDEKDVTRSLSAEMEEDDLLLKVKLQVGESAMEVQLHYGAWAWDVQHIH